VPDFALEIAAGGVVAGIDEAGRGPLAGPVIAAAVVLNRETLPPEIADGLDDSKRLSPSRRAVFFTALQGEARIGIGGASVAEIDQLNILQATFLAMVRAFGGLGSRPDRALVDGNRLPALPIPAQAVVGGDRRSLSIAAASIVAKVTRDRIMAGLARRHPGYGWEHNAGYSTKAHRDALARLGVTPHHRRGFAPVTRILTLTL